MSINQNMGFLLFDIQSMQITSILIFNSSTADSEHFFAISPNEQILVDWWNASTPIRIYNISLNSISLINQ